MRVHQGVIVMLRRIAMGDPLRDPGQIRIAQQDQHQAYGQLHRQAERGGITTLKRIIAAPTTKIVMVWPMPHSTPMIQPAGCFAAG